MLDIENRDLRLARAAALNIIPTTTGAMKMLGKLIPELEKHISGVSIRVPVAKVSLVDFTFVVAQKITVSAIHDACLNAAEHRMKGIVALSMLPLVSSDYSGSPYSVTVDGAYLPGQMAQWARSLAGMTMSWGYSERLKDFLLFAQQTEIRMNKQLLAVIVTFFQFRQPASNGICRVGFWSLWNTFSNNLLCVL